MPHTFNQITTWFISFGYAAIFIGAVFEGPIIAMIGGSFAALGYFNIFLVFFIILLGDMVGDNLYYIIGRYGGEKFLTRFGHYIGINSEKVMELKNHFDNRGSLLLFAGKVTHGVGGLVLIAAGMVKMSFGRYFWYNSVISIIKALVFVLIGYFFGQAITKINNIFEFISAIFACLFLIACVYYLYQKLNDKK